MKTEFEVKILNVDVAAFKKKLAEVGAKKHKEREMRRYVYDIEKGNENSWIRLRDKGGKVALTIKEIKNDEIGGTEEIEVEVSDFEMTNKLLERLGFSGKAYQENKRISYRLNDVKIEIDSWPKIPPYVEIEAETAEKVWETVELLGYEKEDTTSIGVMKVYKKYGIDIHDFRELKF